MTRSIALLLAVAALVPGATRAAQSYDNCTAYIDSLPAVITTQGTWCLRKDLGTAMSSGHAIDIQANNVTIDCNHFKVGGLGAGVGTAATGIHALNRVNATVRQCTIRGFRQGIHLDNDISGESGGHLVEDNLLDQNTWIALEVRGAGSSRVQRNRIHDTGGSSFGTAWGMHVINADVIDNAVVDVAATGANSNAIGIFIEGWGLEARGNVVRNLAPTGTGQAIGMSNLFGTTNFTGNSVSAGTAAAANGAGIRTRAGTPKAVCRGNSVTFFPTGIDANCLDAGGNAVQ